MSPRRTGVTRPSCTICNFNVGTPLVVAIEAWPQLLRKELMG
ncbi:hypothetical protein [Cupriavidus necator]|nr:hypothetical protein [Cupriavidus necator]WKA42602.1 hypothetical protein QWP09_08820 [Cupriavidus necator]